MSVIVYRLQPWPAVDRLVFDACPPGFQLRPMARDASPEERHALLADADFLLGSWVTTNVKLSEEDFAGAPRLKLLQLMSAGYEHVPLDIAARFNVPVAHFGGSNASVVAEHTILLILALMRHLRTLDQSVRTGAWRSGEPTMRELRGKQVGLIGLGYIGREVQRRLHAFDARVEYTSRSSQSMPLDELLRTSDIVSLHLSLSPETHHFLNADRLALMKPGALLINTARGPVVDQTALFDALQSGHLGGAGLDVLDPEPPPPDSPLLQLPNVVFTPHNAGSAEEVWPRVVALCFDNIQRVARGESPLHLAR